MKKKRVYISGPISGYDLEERRQAFAKVDHELRNYGYKPVNPVLEADLHPDDKTTHQHMRRDIMLLMQCDAIYMMEKWTHSKGCFVEMMVATSIGLPVFFEENNNSVLFK